MKRVSSLPGASAPGFPLPGFCNDQQQWVAKTQRKTQSRKDSRYKKTQSRRVLDSQASLLDSLQIKIASWKRGALPRKKITLLNENATNSKQFEKAVLKLGCFLLFLTQQIQINPHDINMCQVFHLMQ